MRTETNLTLKLTAKQICAPNHKVKHKTTIRSTLNKFTQWYVVISNINIRKSYNNCNLISIKIRSSINISIIVNFMFYYQHEYGYEYEYYYQYEPHGDYQYHYNIILIFIITIS